MTTFADRCTHDALFGATDDRVDGGEWATPQEFFDKLDKEFRFSLDAAASAHNAKCKHYYTKEQNGLLQPWTGNVFCNPPYGKVIVDWLAKGRSAAKNGAVVVFLIHARTDTRWFHDHVYGIADEIRFVKGRLKFVHKDGTADSAPFPSMVVIYRPQGHKMTDTAVQTAPTTEAIEKVLIQGDLAKLTIDQRLSYLNRVCESLGLNPLTRPFAFITLNNKLTMYATKDATEQLRKVHKVSITDLKHEMDSASGLYIVTVFAQAGTRLDAATGVISTKNLSGENLANAMMKCETKAKRRVTLSICGLGMLDETEVEDIHEQVPVNVPALPAVPEVNQTPAVATDAPRPGEPKRGRPRKAATETKTEVEQAPTSAELPPPPTENVHGVDITDDDIPDNISPLPTPEERQKHAAKLRSYGADGELLKGFVLTSAGVTDSKQITNAAWEKIFTALDEAKEKGKINDYLSAVLKETQCSSK